MTYPLVFDHWTSAQLDKAREIAVDVMKLYGDLVGDEYQRFLANPWNDHCSVQTALRAMPKASEITAAQARSREDAEIMRRAASSIESHNMVEWPGEAGVSLRCNICGAPDDIELGPKHTEQCFVTKLRARADELEGRTDG